MGHGPFNSPAHRPSHRCPSGLQSASSSRSYPLSTCPGLRKATCLPAGKLPQRLVLETLWACLKLFSLGNVPYQRAHYVVEPCAWPLPVDMGVGQAHCGALFKLCVLHGADTPNNSAFLIPALSDN